ncbi:40S ribosomal protein S3a [Gregarina niphandrodes]|uniref:Small ribosomal subunit protein eS1 n=1 Tax=Gregarina niphandrodes TaxID=110365 RepID=A0A023AY82_GRENI|nr:40S ribosomal protein S3a [Gregarina niphandrodes]EZG43627.1 40S ribosomal protein S3a [Gregarina niphandrodes]|eukprot:XP_011133155.1 40S ribosomal protein S3a [Gregarina niphandrodes]
MAIGKNKRVSKGGRKGGKKKVVDAFAKKEHYLVKAPAYFKTANIGNTLCSRSQGLKKAEDNLKGRVFDVNMADLQKDEGQGHRKIKLICEDVQGRNCLTDFHGMDITRDYYCFIVRKWHTLIQAHVDVKTLDGYQLRMFAIGMTRRSAGQKKVTSYAQSSQVRAIRQNMVKIMQEEASQCNLRELVRKLIPEAVGKQIEKACKHIYPLQNVCVRKVKVVKKPKTDAAKLLELHNGVEAGNGADEAPEAKNLLTAQVEA